MAAVECLWTAEHEFCALTPFHTSATSSSTTRAIVISGAFRTRNASLFDQRCGIGLEKLYLAQSD